MTLRTTFFIGFVFLLLQLNSQTLSTLAGTGQNGYVDGPGEMALFDRPDQMAVDKDNNIYVADYGNNVKNLQPLEFNDFGILNRKKFL